MAVVRFATGAVRVRAPATSANLGPGFDSLGLALALYDEVTVRAVDSGVRVTISGEGAGELPTDGSHLVVRSMMAAFDRLGARPRGLELSSHNRIPQARGLGSSSAAIVAGILAARALVESGPDLLDTAGVLELATELEGHPDNVAACLLGGLTIAWLEAGDPAEVGEAVAGEVEVGEAGAGEVEVGEAGTGKVEPGQAGGRRVEGGRAEGTGGDAARRTEPGGGGSRTRPRARAVSLRPAAGVRPIVLIPEERGLTSIARAALPEAVPHRDAAHNAGRAALLVHALTGDPGLLLAATEDRLHQPYRAAGMPATAALVTRLRRAGIPAVVSGAGPSVLAFGTLGETPITPGWRVIEPAIDVTGAIAEIDLRHAERGTVAAGRAC